jgi:hypothetical protein
MTTFEFVTFLVGVTDAAMSNEADHHPSSEKSASLRPRRNVIVLVLIISLLVILPVTIEQKSLSSISWVFEQDVVDHSKYLANATHNSTRSQPAFLVQTPDALNDSSKIPGLLTRESSPLKYPFLHQIDRYFEMLHRNSSEIKWIRDYIYWHYEMRKNFPEGELFDNTSGPNITIVYFDPEFQQGGLTDRMKSLGHLLQRSYKEQRVLLFKWYNGPLPLESFVIPHLLNFTVPSHASTTTPKQLRASYDLEGGRVKLVKCINQLGNYLHPYDVIWNAIFQPSIPVKEAVDDTMTTLGLVGGKFDAVHCRIGHPAYRNKQKYEGSKDRIIDREGGYKFEGTNRVGAMNTAIHGIQCAKWIAKQHNFSSDDAVGDANRSIYFYSDLPALVKTVVKPSSLKARGEVQLSLVEELKKLGSEIKVVGRTNASTTHLENRKEGTSDDAFLSTFVDLYIAAQARCIAMGVGRFAYMAAKLSGTSCWTRHQTPERSVRDRWGMTLMSREVPSCQIAKI